jgi:hypothetical protein
MTTSIDSDEFTLYTTINPNALPPVFDPSKLISVIWPFERSVWLMAVVTTLLLTLAMRAVEPQNDENEEQDASNLSTCNWFKQTIEGLIGKTYEMVMAYFGGSGTILSAARTWPARIIAVGVGIFVFIHFNSYTGSLAAFYVSNSVSQLGVIGSLDDVAANNGRLCVTQALFDAAAPTLTASVPQSSILVADREGPMLESLYQGRCTGAILGKFEALHYVGASAANFTACTDPRDPRNWSTCADPAVRPAQFRLSPATCGGACRYARRYCGLVPVADARVASMVLMWQLPVAPWLQPWVSWGVQAVVSVGNLSLHQTREMLAPNPVVCTGPAAPSGSAQLEGLASVFVVCGGLLVASSLLHAFSIAAARSRCAHAPGPAADGKSLQAPAGVSAAVGHLGGPPAAGGRAGQQAGQQAGQAGRVLSELRRVLDRLEGPGPPAPHRFRSAGGD